MEENKVQADAACEQALVQSASGESTQKAWSACAALAGRLGGGVKTLWSKIHPDRSPEAVLATLNANQTANRARLDQMKPELDGVYREIVAKKKDYQSSSPVRQRILKVELQTLMARYKSLEREFTILSENERSIEAVKGRFLDVLAYDKRGALNTNMVDGLADNLDDKAEEAEDIQDSLADLERAGKRRDRIGDEDFDAALAGFDGDLGLAETVAAPETSTERGSAVGERAASAPGASTVGGLENFD